jgi:hypothetical protein
LKSVPNEPLRETLNLLTIAFFIFVDPEAIEKMRQVIVHHLSHGIEEKKREIELIDYRLKLAEDTWERLQIAWSRSTSKRDVSH